MKIFVVNLVGIFLDFSGAVFLMSLVIVFRILSYL